MKKLTLVRHAKSSWGDPGLSDRRRKLNKRGKDDALVMGDRLAARGVEADRMITSPATRALKTAETIVMALGHPWDELIIDERLYHASADEILEVVHDLPDYLDDIMLFGHNPGMTDLINMLYTAYLDNLPTCGVFELTYKIDAWPQVGDVPPEKIYFDYPKKEA